MSDLETASPIFRPVVANALYPAVERGLAADLAAVRALDGIACPVCTLLLMADGTSVTDATDVPSDTVRAQFEHIAGSVESTGVLLGVLANHQSAAAAFDFAAETPGPTVLDLQISGPTGETVLTSRGIDAVMDRLAVPDLVIVSRLDAEPISGGEIQSLDDAQVAAQRLIKRGARAVVIKCGTLPARHFEVRDAPSSGDGAPSHPEPDADEPTYNADLFFDGESFALFEAPHITEGTRPGASSAFAVAALHALVNGRSLEEALQVAKRFATESLRASVNAKLPGLNFGWHQADAS